MVDEDNGGVAMANILSSHGFLFYANDQNFSIQQVFSDYKFDDVREDDIVVDIGANIGAFSTAVARKVKKVYAIEPIFWKELQANIDLNKLTNVEVIKQGIGNSKSPQKIEFFGRSDIVSMLPFESFKMQLPNKRIDFLKSDCEGCEWSIAPESFEGIRRIEAEMHIRKEHEVEETEMFNRWLNWLQLNKYTYKLTRTNLLKSGPILKVHFVSAEKTESLS